MKKKIILLTLTVCLLLCSCLAFGLSSSAEEENVNDPLWTPYGYISESFADASKYPFAVFKKVSWDGNPDSYVFHKAYSEWGGNTGAAQAAKGITNPSLDSGKVASKIDTAVVYLRGDVTVSANNDNISQSGGTVILDLGGHTITSTVTLFPLTAKSYYPTITDENGKKTIKDTWINLKNGNIITSKALFAGDINAGSYDFNKSFYVTIENCNISYPQNKSIGVPIIYGNGSYSGISSDLLREDGSFIKLDVSIDLKNCTIDLTGTTKATPKIINFDKKIQEGHATFSGCTVVLPELASLTYGLNEAYDIDTALEGNEIGADTVRFISDTKIKIPTSAVAENDINKTFSVGDGTSASVVSTSLEGDYTLYTLATSVATEYDYIPAEYASTELYPFAVFNSSKKFVGAYSLFGLDNGSSALSASKTGGYTILLRRDFIYSEEQYNNLSQTRNSALTIDLGGHTFTSKRILFHAQKKTPYDTSIIIKNGTLILEKNLIGVSAWRNTTTYPDATELNGKGFYMTFSDVTIKTDSANTTEGILAFGKENNSHDVLLDATFNNCIIDTSNRGYALLFKTTPELSSTQKISFNIKINGGKIIGGDSVVDISDCAESDDAALTFGTYEGKYTEFEGSKAPKGTDNNGGMIFLKTSENGVKSTYSLASSIFAYSPKTSITLDSSLVLNIYLPIANLVSFSVNGVPNESLETLNKCEIDGEEYYHLELCLASSEAARDIVLAVNVSGNQNTATGRFTMSIPKYAEKIINSEKTTDTESLLVNDILNYIKHAYEFFGSDMSELALLDSLLDSDYDKMSKPEEEGSDKLPTDGINGVTFVLDSTPKIRFYIPENADIANYSFYIDGKNIKHNVDFENNWVDIDLYAYQMCDEILYSINGEYKGSYHMNSYYQFAKGQSDEKLLLVFESFFRYCQSARAYRFEQLGDLSYSHTHTFFERDVEMSVNSASYHEKICACGHSEKTLKTGLDDGTRPIKVLFLGNSYTSYNNMSSIFRDITAGQGIDITVAKVTKGSWHLYQYMHKEDEGGKNFYAALEKDDYDYIFIQDGSTQVLAAIGEFYEGVRNVGKLAEDDGAKVILYQTWGRKEPNDTLNKYNLTNETMAWTVAAAYEAISRETGYTVSPVGSAFLDVYQNHPEIELYNSDFTHPSLIGSYLVALCHYATLFGRSPIGVEYTLDLDNETALILQTAAHNAVFGESIVPESYRTNSEGITAHPSTNSLTSIPEGSEIISVGIQGSSGTVAYNYTSNEVITDPEVLANLANIDNGVSIIGVSKMITSLTRLVDGIWSGTTRFTCVFDENKYFVNGKVDNDEPYDALITYNFGEVVNITAIGYFSGTTGGYAQAQDVYISNNGLDWTSISAGYDMTLGGEWVTFDKENIPTDSKGKASDTFVLYSAGEEGVYAQYVRIGIRVGSTNATYDMNTFELVIYGKKEDE